MRDVSPNNPEGPDRDAALALYRQRHAVYDIELSLYEPLRRDAVMRLGLREGDVVLDVGCGTGLSLALLRQCVGASGRVIGIEQSPEMIGHAQSLVRRHGWDNVELICSPVEDAEIDAAADAAMFHYVHDILRSPAALDRVVPRLAPGARVVACGLRWAPAWAWPVNMLVLSAAVHSITSFEGLAAPWDDLAARIGGMEVESVYGGGAYVAYGVQKRSEITAR